MIWVGILFAVLTFVILCVICFKLDDKCAEGACIGLVLVICCVLAIVLTCGGIKPSITPIDVYRGKTTLEITYRDSVAVDSVVVWKEE